MSVAVVRCSPFRGYITALVARHVAHTGAGLPTPHLQPRRAVAVSATLFDNQPPKRRKQPYIKPKSAPRSPAYNPLQESVRLAKALAHAGVASRRASEVLIQEGKVKVNGQLITEVGTTINPSKDKVTVGGQPVDVRPQQLYYFAVNKPLGYICSNVDPERGKRAVDLLQPWLDTWQRTNSSKTQLPPRLFTVGRLDVASQGLIFITNDGDWANSVQHPRHNITKEYVVRVNREPSRREVQALMRGAVVDGAHVVPQEVTHLKGGGGKNDRVRLVVSEGRNREVRVLLASVGLEVLVLKRTRIGGFRLPSDLKAGNYMALKRADIQRVTDPGAQEEAMAQVAGVMP